MGNYNINTNKGETMTALILTITAIIGLNTVPASLFNDGPYGFKDEHFQMEKCQRNTQNTSNICAIDSDYLSVGEYKLESEVKTKPNTGEPLNWEECSYWAGCYMVERLNK